MRRALQLALLLCAALVLCTPAKAAYSYYRTITTDHTQAGSNNTTNFSMYVLLNSGNVGTTIKTVANGGHVNNTVTQSGGVGGTEPADLVFGTSSTCSTLVPWEVLSYSASGGTLQAWVNLSTLSHTTDNTLYVCYGDATVSTQQNTGTNSPSHAFNSNFAGVWHLADASFGSGATLLDSTSNANNMTVTGTGLSGTGTSFPTVTPLFVQGIKNSSVFTYGDLATHLSIGGGTATSWSFWMYGYASSAPSGDMKLGGAGPAHSSDFSTMTDMINPSFTPGWQGVKDSSFNFCQVSPITITAAWYRFDVTVNSSGTVNMYENGTNVNTCSAAVTSAITLDEWFNNNYTQEFQLYLEDIRLMTGTAATADQITAEYANQKASSTFLTIGSETGGSASYVAAVIERLLSSLASAVGFAAHTSKTTELVRGNAFPAGSAGHSGIATERLATFDGNASQAQHFAVPFDRALSLQFTTMMGIHFGATYDLVATSDRAAGLGAHLGTSLESLRIYDLPAGSAGHSAKTTDLIYLSEASTGHGAHFAAPFDSSTPADASAGRAVHSAITAELLPTRDLPLGSAAHLGVVLESLATGAYAAGTAAHFAGVRETFTILDFSSTSHPILVTVSEFLGHAGDFASRQSGLHAAPSEALALLDSPSGSAAHFAVTAELLRPSDRAQLGRAAFVSELLLGGSTVGQLAAHLAAPFESLFSYGAVSTSAGRSASASELLARLDTSALRLGKGVVVFESLPGVMTSSQTAGHLGTSLELLAGADRAGGLAAHAAAAIEALARNDAGVGHGAHFRASSEPLHIYDLGTYPQGVHNYVAFTTDFASLYDLGIGVAAVPTPVVILSEHLALYQAFLRIGAYVQQITILVVH